MLHIAHFAYMRTSAQGLDELASCTAHCYAKASTPTLERLAYDCLELRRACRGRQACTTAWLLKPRVMPPQPVYTRGVHVSSTGSSKLSVRAISQNPCSGG